MTNGRWRLDLPQEGGLTDEERRVLKRWADTLPLAFTNPPASYTPRWYADTTEITVGDGVCRGTYSRVGPLVLCEIDCLFGSTTNLNGGTGLLKWTVPDDAPFATPATYTLITPLAGHAVALEYAVAWNTLSPVRDTAPNDQLVILQDEAANTFASTSGPAPAAPGAAWSMAFWYFTTLGLTDR